MIHNILIHNLYAQGPIREYFNGFKYSVHSLSFFVLFCFFLFKKHISRDAWLA